MFKQRNAITTVLFSTALLLGSNAYSDSRYADAYGRDAYIGANLAVFEYAEDGFDDANVAGIFGRLGKQYTDNLAAEVRLGFGLGSDTVSGVDFEMQEFYGAYLKVSAPVGERLDPYLLVGYTQISVEVSALGVSVDDSADDFSYGVGTDIDLDKDLQGSVEFVRYADKDGAKFTSLSFGLSKAF